MVYQKQGPQLHQWNSPARGCASIWWAVAVLLSAVSTLPAQPQTKPTESHSQSQHEKRPARVGGAKLTPLEQAIYSDDCDAVSKFINAGANVNASTGNGSPLTEALALGEPEIAELLIHAGADVNARDDCGSHPAYYAASHSDDEMLSVLKELVRRGADVRSSNIGGETPLHSACYWEGTHIKIVRYLLEHGADANAIDDSGDTPLHFLAYLPEPSALETAKVLVEHGAKTNVKNKKGQTAADVAWAHHKTELLDFLSRH